MGAGAGGGIVAAELAQAGLRVALMDRGRNFSPADIKQRVIDWASCSFQLTFCSSNTGTGNETGRRSAVAHSSGIHQTSGCYPAGRDGQLDSNQ
jgi:choline dehydrogenase-like flavoprotein